MTVTAIDSALPGEHVLAVAPQITYPSVDAGWLRHLRLFTGRALDDVALTGEQDARAGRLAVLGQTLAPGIISGLEASYEPDGGGMFHITAGYGLLPTGEDVTLGNDLVVARSALGAIDPTVRAGVLVLVPVTARRAGRFDPLDPCERDDSEDAFADEQRVDGVQVALIPWDAAWGALDATNSDRNSLAYLIYELERKLPFGEVAPWQLRGLPLALVGLSAGAVTYVDRYAVARSGGHTPERTPLVAAPGWSVGPAALWQARILQLADHVADARAVNKGTLPTVASMKLAFLPPAGVVPADALNMSTLTNAFFPPLWRLCVTPVPSEQLDSMLARAASLAPLSTAITEEAVVLVPVPQAVYEPRLLEVEQLSPEFKDTIDDLTRERTQLLGHRMFLRGIRDVLMAARDPKSVETYPDPDPAALEPEGNPEPLSDGEVEYDTFVDPSKVRRSQALVDLRGRLAQSPALEQADLTTFDQQGLTKFIQILTQRAASADDAIDLGFLHGQADIYRLRQLMLGNELGTKLATSPALAAIAKGDTAVAVRQDLAKFYDELHQPAPVTPAPAGGTPVAPTTSALHLVSLMPSARELAVTEITGISRARPVTIGPTGIKRAIQNKVITTSLTPHATVDEVRGAAPVIGAAEFRNVTVGERIDPPPADTTRQWAASTRQSGVAAIQNLKTLGLKIDDLTIYGLPTADNKRDMTFGELKDLKDVFAHDTAKLQSTDEGSYFHATVTILEGHIATLRGLEGRVAQLRDALADCQDVASKIGDSQAAVETRLRQVEHDLEDRRHAVATAEALLAEEIVRIARINARRGAVLKQHVQMLAYVRPRYFEAIAEVPELSLEPALLDQPVPACLAGHDDAPPQISQMVALLREAPLWWLHYAPPILRYIDRVELLHGLVLTARQRAAAMAQNGFDSPLATTELAGRFGPRIIAIGRGQLDSVWQERSKTAELDVGKFAGLSWLESRDAAQYFVSPGDIIEGNHRRPPAITDAHGALVQIEKVAGCLWAQVGQVEPIIRLAWAEALDAGQPQHGLVTLAALPRWRDVPYLDRKRIELLAEWLIDQANASVPAALAWFHDLVRACILLASHSPIDELISGDVPVSSPAGPGQLVPVKIDPSRIRIGMHVSFFQGNQVVAQGVVEDLVGEQARARIAQATSQTLRLEASTRARFALPGTPAVPLTRELL